MTAAALPRSPSVRGWLTRPLAAVVFLCSAAPASAEFGATVSIFSDARFRGYSLSAARPVALLDLSYDDPNGLYGAVSGSIVADDGIRPLGLQLNGGYAKRLARGITVDVGAIHSTYARYSRPGKRASYTEIYAGATYKFVSARVAYSPHYFQDGATTLYGELDANFSPARKFRLNGHVGALVPLDYRDPEGRSRTQYDWRIGASREVGRVSLHVIVSGGGPGRDYYRERTHNRTALVLGISCPL